MEKFKINLSSSPERSSAAEKIFAPQEPARKERRRKKEKFEDRFEREGFGGINKVVVRGSVPLAIMSGRSLELARDVDIFFIKSGSSKKMDIQSFDNLSQAKEKLPDSAIELIERFVKMHNLEHMPMQVVHASEYFLEKMRIFNNAPEAILWDNSLEIKKDIFRPISVVKKNKLLQKIWRFPLNDRVFDSIKDNIKEAYELKLYEKGELYEGEVPSHLEPANNSLATALRIEDLGQRFDIPANHYSLTMANRMVKEGVALLAVPIEREQSIEKKAFGGGDYLDGIKEKDSGAIDIIFCDIAKKGGIKELLAQKYPHLAALTQKIEDAGGLGEFIKKYYGEAYLYERYYINLDSPSFADSVLSLPEQRIVLSAWDRHMIQQLFKGDAKRFINECSEINKTSPISELSDERLIQAVLASHLERLLAFGAAEDREEAYNIMGHMLERAHYGYGSKSFEDYNELKEKIREAVKRERSAWPRKVLMENLKQLAEWGDLTISSDFVEIVKKEGAQLKVEKSVNGSGEILSPEGMNALRALFRFRHRDARRAIFDLIVHPNIDGRVKKVCLRNLTGQGGLELEGWDRILKEDLKKDAKNIPWEDYVGLWRVENIASSAMRRSVLFLAYDTFSDIRQSGKRVFEVKNAIAPQLPWEFFLVLYTLSKGNPEQIKSWEKLIIGAKSNKLRESLLHSLVNFPPEIFSIMTEKIIKTPETTKEHILLADRLIKKIHFLKIVERKRIDKDTTQEKPVQALLEESKAPSLLEVRLDEKLVAGLSELTERGDLTSSKIHSLFQAWENPEPFLLYTAELASRSKYEESAKRTLHLVGEMLVHIDPDKMVEWKQWRYNRENPIVAEQMRNLSDKQVESYAKDEFADLGEVLVELLPSDKPERIRREIFHAVQHDWPASGVLEAQSVTRFFPNMLAAIEGGGQFNAEGVLARDIVGISLKMKTIKEWLDLQENNKFSKGLAEHLSAWQNNEAQKSKKLIELGYRGDESAAEISEIIAQMREAKEDAKKISAISNLQPNPLSPKVQALLNRRGLSVSASPEDIKNLQESIRIDIETAEGKGKFIALQKELFGKREINLEDWQRAIKELKMAQLFLKLGILSPQLIAFNKISPEKKKASLQSSIDSLRNYFYENKAIAETIERIRGTIDEESSSVGKDHLAVIFTDNPLAMFSIGKFPIGAESCQHYRNGDILLGAYAADAYTKMMLLVDLDKLPSELQSELEGAEDTDSRLNIFRENTESFLNASVGRRITKIVRDNQSNKSQLFLEPVYTSLNRESVTRILNAFAVTRLQPNLGMEVVRGGGDGEVLVPESRNYFQYEDGEMGGPGGGGGGLGTKIGEYVMPAQKLTEADYLVRA